MAIGALFWFARGTCACATPVHPASPVDGVVIGVDAQSLGDVRGFTLRTMDGLTLTLTLGTLENATAFSPSHLSEHQATSEPIRVWFRVEAGQSVVYRLEDATPASTGT